MKVIYGDIELKIPAVFIPVLLELSYFYGYDIAEKLNDYFEAWGDSEWVSLNTKEFLELTQLLARIQAGEIHEHY